jgi:hypothetical protein
LAYAGVCGKPPTKPDAADAAPFDDKAGRRRAVRDLTAGVTDRTGERHRDRRTAAGQMKRAFARDVERGRAVGQIRGRRIGLCRD